MTDLFVLQTKVNNNLVLFRLINTLYFSLVMLKFVFWTSSQMCIMNQGFSLMYFALIFQRKIVIQQWTLVNMSANIKIWYPFFASTFLHLNAVFFNHFLTPTFIYSDFSSPTQLSLHIFSHFLKPTLFSSHFSSQTDFRRHHLFSGRSQGTLSTQRTSKICLT